MCSFGERLRNARKRKGLTQAQVKQITGITDKSISRYETGATTPEPDKLRKLIQLYDISADYILGLTDEKRSLPCEGSSMVTPIACCDAALLELITALSPEDKARAGEYIEMLKTVSGVKTEEDSAD